MSPCLGAWSRSLNQLPYGRCVRPLHISIPAVPTLLGQTPLKPGDSQDPSSPDSRGVGVGGGGERGNEERSTKEN